MNARAFARLAAFALASLGALGTTTTAHAEIGAATTKGGSAATHQVCSELEQLSNLSYNQQIEWADNSCATLGYLRPFPVNGEPGIEPTECADGQFVVGQYCYRDCPTGYTGTAGMCWPNVGTSGAPMPTPEEGHAECPVETVMYGGLCVSGVPVNCPDGGKSTLGPTGYYCGASATTGGSPGEGGECNPQLDPYCDT